MTVEVDRRFAFGRACAGCGRTIERSLTFDAAFASGDYPPRLGPCPDCGAERSASGHGSLPEFDDATALTRWARDLRVCFLDQDEDLIIAAAPAADIVAALDDPQTERGRRFTLIEALLVQGAGDGPGRQTALDWLDRNRSVWENQKGYGYASLRKPVLAALNSR